MLGDAARRALLEKYARTPLQVRALININEEPLKPYDIPLTNPDLRYTNFDYTLRYCMQPAQGKDKLQKYYIYSDLLDGEKFKFDKWEEVEEEAKKNKSLAFLMKYSNFNKETFEIVKKNIFYCFKIYFDYAKYCNKLLDQIESTTGVRPDYSMFIDPALVEINDMIYRDWLKEYNKEL